MNTKGLSVGLGNNIKDSANLKPSMNKGFMNKRIPKARNRNINTKTNLVYKPLEPLETKHLTSCL